MSGSGYSLLRLTSEQEAAVAFHLDVEPARWSNNGNVTYVAAALFSLGAMTVSNYEPKTMDIEYKALFTEYFPTQWGYYFEFFKLIAKYGGEVDSFFARSGESILVQTYPEDSGQDDLMAIQYNAIPARWKEIKPEVDLIREYTNSPYENPILVFPPARSVVASN